MKQYLIAPKKRRRRLWVVSMFFACLGLRAQAAAGAPPPPDRYEPGLLPALAQDADVGFKFGVFAQLARFQGDQKPYAWRAQVLAAASVRDGATGTELPYREAYLRLDKPHALVEPLRIAIHLGYLRTTNLGYFGLGNASSAEALWRGLPSDSDEYVRARHFYQYDGVAPVARLCARYRLTPGWQAMAELNLQWVTVNVYPGSLLEQDLAAPSGPGFPLGKGLQPRVTAGMVYDTRDHETAPSQGAYHDASVRCGGAVSAGDTYCAVNLTLRGYRAIAGQYLSLAGRLLGDFALGDPPLVELTRYGGIEGGTGPGGGRGIRGVPQGRLAGKGKLIGNLEVRSFFLPFAIGSQRFSLGAVAFADAGRVWAEGWSDSPRDGSFRVHWGAGGGPRLRWGDSLLIRADVAYAPLGAALGATPAIYVDVDMVM
jgi:hypothetical protein